MMAIRVRPGIRKTRLMSRTSNVRKAEWDQVRGNHQGQRQDHLINRPDTRLYLTTLAETSKSPCIAGAIHTGHWRSVKGALNMARRRTPDGCQYIRAIKALNLKKPSGSLAIRQIFRSVHSLEPGLFEKRRE